ncbi:MAG: hypothetical protein KatS3mg110_2555 [Pirellulaceae bacterium]|nr:MAG: hypothetical protein KatS3mg110_2555 [Pirellulaceae bacterium]
MAAMDESVFSVDCCSRRRALCRLGIAVAGSLAGHGPWLALAADGSDTEPPHRDPFLIVLPQVDPAFALRVRQAVTGVPAPLRRQLCQAGWRCVVSTDLVSYVPELAGQRPRGWPAGASWAQVDAVHLPQQRQVIVAQWRKNARGDRVACHRVPGAVWHELGHAWDVFARQQAAEGRPLPRACYSESPDFLEAWKKDMAGLTARAADSRWNYYLQGNHRGRQEIFAEAFAVSLGSGSDEHLADEFAQGFPSVCRLVREWLDGLGR